jgi:threonine dehydratase
MAEPVRISLEDVERAAELIKDIAVLTPMEESRWLSALTVTPSC